MRLYHLVNQEHGLENIKKRRLKIARLHELNDPFEFLSPASHDPYRRKRFIAARDGVAQRAGLICFSKSWHNPVIWSHYADRHRGICLGFDVWDQAALPVRYSSKRIVFPDRMFDGINPQQSDTQYFLSAITTKFTHWRYENEVRILTSIDAAEKENGLLFKGFCSHLRLREVIVGATGSASRDEIMGVLGDLAGDVRVAKARLSFKRFAVVTQRRRDLWT